MEDEKKNLSEQLEQVADDEQVEQETTKKEKKNKYKEKIESLEKEVAQLKDKLLRNAAELENFKKRMTLEKINDRKFASKNLVHDILEPLDQLNMIINMETDEPILKNFLYGFKMLNSKFYEVLTNDGLKEIDALNKQFDPKYHYAIEKESIEDKPNGINLKVIQKGYLYKEQLLRPAMVKVNEWSDENGENK
ncbi:MAG: nucleotide exchange factor GrpE [Acholeplasmataceae bacterium]|nr:nucleotide exchange factor GrpE [Acholeplasmataceae bacterium]